MIVLHWPPLCVPHPPSKFSANSLKFLSLSLRNEALLASSLVKSKFGPKSSIKCSCIKEEHTAKVSEDFSVLESDIPWDNGSMWSTLALYLFSLHVPLSFGGLSVVAYVLHQPILDPQTESLSLLAVQTFELNAVLWLVKCVAKPQYELLSFFQAKNQSKERNWLPASVLGFGFLILLVFFTSLIADQLIGPKDFLLCSKSLLYGAGKSYDWVSVYLRKNEDVNNPILKEILSSGSISKTACFLVYCVVTPLLEEIVYRGFLLTSLASEMKWHQAVIISSAVFSAAHFSDAPKHSKRGRELALQKRKQQQQFESNVFCSQS